jgi:hypothetical protein
MPREPRVIPENNLNLDVRISNRGIAAKTLNGRYKPMHKPMYKPIQPFCDDTFGQFGYKVTRTMY